VHLELAVPEVSGDTQSRWDGDAIAQNVGHLAVGLGIGMGRYLPVADGHQLPVLAMEECSPALMGQRPARTRTRTRRRRMRRIDLSWARYGPPPDGPTLVKECHE
jgi:hypothetical protein